MPFVHMRSYFRPIDRLSVAKQTCVEMTDAQKHLFQDDTGAVTVDWVVLTAALVGLGLATMAVVSSGVEDTSGDVKAQLESDGIIKTSFPAPWAYADRTGAYTATMASEGGMANSTVLNLLNISLNDFTAEYESNPGDAAMFLDEYAASYEIAQARELTLPDGAPTPQELDALYEGVLADL